MDFEGEDVSRRPKRRSGWRVFWGIFTGMSVVGNIVLFLIIIGLAAMFATGQRGMFTEEVIKEGPRTNKIAVINLKGIIDGRQADNVYQQIKAASKDRDI